MSDFHGPKRPSFDIFGLIWSPQRVLGFQSGVVPGYLIGVLALLRFVPCYPEVVSGYLGSAPGYLGHQVGWDGNQSGLGVWVGYGSCSG